MNPVYRIQDLDGRGPWKPGFSHIWMDLQRPYLPAFYEEFDIDLIKKEDGIRGCGCLELDQLRDWFSPSEYQSLIELGYLCVCIMADKIVAYSDIQCVFSRRLALNKEFKIVDLYEDV